MLATFRSDITCTHTAHGGRVVTEAGNQISKSLVRALWQKPGQTVHDEVFRFLPS